jgi:nucleoside-diphosphate-sugar epimerase
LLGGAGAVIHAAALHGYHMLQLRMDPNLVFTNNVLSTFHIAAMCARFAIPKLIVTSSASIYDVAAANSQQRALWLDENASLNPRDLYDETKVMSEQIGEYWADRGVNVSCLRTTRFFFDDEISYNVRKLWRGADIRDVAQAHVLAVKAKHKGFRVYNVAAKSPFSQADCARLWRDAPGVLENYYPGITGRFAEKGWNLPASIDRVIDIGRAEKELGFSPQYNFDSFWQSTLACESSIQPRKARGRRRS